MSKAKMIMSVIKEYGAGWLLNRTLYSAKLKVMRTVPQAEKWFEKKKPYPGRLDVFDIDVNDLQVFLREKLNEQDRKRLIENADKAARGIITGFSSVELDYGDPVDWQLNPLTGKRSDERKKWYGIPDFDNERGDIKVIWEASRFSHFVLLARAYLLTEDNKYCRAFSLQLKDWLEKNPYSFGANFKCSQECSLRMINALLAFTVFRKAGIATDADASNMKDLVDRCYRKILGNFFYAYKCIKNNHTISELTGMIVGAWCTGDEKQLSKAYKLLDRVIDEQFTQDGGYGQLSFNYQRLAMQDVGVVLSIEGKTGKRLSDKSIEKLKNSAILMFQCQDVTGDMPNYGNNDGALVFPVTSCGFRDFRPVINTVFALTMGIQAYQDGIHQEELIWFAGNKKPDNYPFTDLKRQSSRFDEAGLFTIRDRDSWAMIVSNNYRSRPGHMDQQHFDLWIRGVNVFCDAGTYSYASGDVRKYVGNESHNTALVENAPQMNARGPFMIYDRTKRELDRCDSHSYAGKTISGNGYKHIREVKHYGSAFEITDKCDKNYRVLFHTLCVAEKSNDGYLLKYGDNVLCKMKSSGAIAVEKGQRSLYYLQRQDTTCLSVIGQADTEIKTVIEIVEGDNDD